MTDIERIAFVSDKTLSESERQELFKAIVLDPIQALWLFQDPQNTTEEQHQQLFNSVAADPLSARLLFTHSNTQLAVEQRQQLFNTIITNREQARWLLEKCLNTITKVQQRKLRRIFAKERK